jgi:dTMP kinase
MAKLTTRKGRGFFLLIEGADGSGKTTLARRLVAALKREGYNVCPVREPGGTQFSEKVRRLLIDAQGAMNARAELFLFLAARAQLVDDVIRPALDRGMIVVADRFSLSTLAYQSGGRGLPLQDVAHADAISRAGISPDLTVVLHVTEKQAAERLRKLGRSRDRIEQESRPFHARVRRFYDHWAKRRRAHILIDSAVGPDEVFELVHAEVGKRLMPRQSRGRNKAR